VRVVADRFVDITFRLWKGLYELSSQCGEEETGIAAVGDSVRKEERPYQEPFLSADFRDCEL